MLFSEYLRQLIESKGLNVSEAARMIHVERSTLSRAVNGTRLPKLTVVSQLSDALRLKPIEIRELHALYNEALIGGDAFRIRERVRKLILTLCDMSTFFEESKTTVISKTDMRGQSDAGKGSPAAYEFKAGTSKVQDAICAAIREAEREGDPSVLLYMPADNEALLSMLANECRAVGGLKIEHLVRYNTSGNESVTDVLNGLDILDYVLRMMLADGMNYQSFFLYCSNDYATEALPNILMTEKRLLRISQDYTRVEVSLNQETIQYYRRHICQLKEFCRPFIQYQYDPMQMMRDYNQFNTGVACQTLMCQPGLGQYVTDEVIHVTARHDLPNRDLICTMASKYFSGMAATSYKNTFFFTKDGVRDFMETGIISDIPTEVYIPMPPAIRREMLGHLIEDIRKKHVSAWLINETLLPIPSHLTIGTSDYPVAVFFSRQIAEKNIPYFSIVVGERIIAKALYDFIMYLPTSTYVYEEHEALDFLEKYLQKSV